MFLSDVRHLTTREYTILETIREQPFARDDLMRSIISGKLSDASKTDAADSGLAGKRELMSVAALNPQIFSESE
jgi:hypothetical protein